MSQPSYDEGFFAYHELGSRNSAREVLPHVFSFVQPKSVVDVGCGNGTWLAELAALGVTDFLGIDGDYVNRDTLLVDRSRFLPRDLSQPLELDRRFDMAMSLEVAEHLPAAAAETFVQSLVRLAPVILFSAAIPYQGGNDHVNEQWPEYWEAIFARHDYVVIDCLRELIWANNKVQPWYSQNILFYVDRRRLRDYPRLAAAFERGGEHPRLALVHPGHYTGLYEYMLNLVHKTQARLMAVSLRLREINLVAFPDWSLPSEMVGQQLAKLFWALRAHPQAERVMVVVNTAQADEQLARELLMRLHHDIFMSGGAPVAGAPGGCGVGRAFGPDQWRALRSNLHLRVVLPQEDSAAISAAEVEGLATISLAEIEQGRTLRGG